MIPKDQEAEFYSFMRSTARHILAGYIYVCGSQSGIWQPAPGNSFHYLFLFSGINYIATRQCQKGYGTGKTIE
jgi:hypothetical protein